VHGETFVNKKLKPVKIDLSGIASIQAKGNCVIIKTAYEKYKVLTTLLKE